MVAPDMATLDQIKEVVRGETDKINLKRDKLTANVEDLCKTVKFLNDKSTTSCFLKCGKQTGS